MIPILKQMALSITPSGVIGVKNDLAFKNSRDLKNFAEFTRCTALIVGRKTAEQMIEANVKPYQDRPMIVVSDTFGCIPCMRIDPHIYYAKSLQQAINIAESMTDKGSVIGWTIAGGKSIYDQFLHGVMANKYKLNSVYMHTCLDEPLLPDTSLCKLEFSTHAIHKALDLRMVNGKSTTETYEAEARVSNGCGGNLSVKIPIQIDWVLDHRYFDTRDVSVSMASRRLIVKTQSGVSSIDADSIIGWTRRSGINSIDLLLSNGLTHEIRPRENSEAAVNGLEMALIKTR